MTDIRIIRCGFFIFLKEKYPELARLAEAFGVAQVEWVAGLPKYNVHVINAWSGTGRREWQLLASNYGSRHALLTILVAEEVVGSVFARLVCAIGHH